MQLSWQIKSFQDLEVEELFELLRLRQSVFVVEQECAYPDIDETDRVAMHLSGWNGDRLIAYARLIKPGVSYAEASIGRIVVSPSARGLGLGPVLMKRAFVEMDVLYPDMPIKIGAQEPLENFYQELGFVRVSDMYMEDGIPHIHMIRN